jgi:hypothetical protein
MASTPELSMSGPEPSSLTGKVEMVISEVLSSVRQPSAWELLELLEQKLGWMSRWEVEPILEKAKDDQSLSRAARNYFLSLLLSGDLKAALIGERAPKREIVSTIDSLVHQSRVYRGSKEFQEMVSFMAKFRDYAPFNNMLVHIQNPNCGYFATETDWKKKFERRLKEDARPMLILAPMHPVMLVYDLDQTEGPELPKELGKFARFEGEWRPDVLALTVTNAAVHDRIRVDFKHLSSTNAGFATSRSSGEWKMRIAIHDALDEPSRYGVVCHELAHIYLGHLGSDKDHWWSSRSNLNHRTVEIEAEAVAFIVTTRLGLKGSSASYVSSHMKDGTLPNSVSLDQIAKVAGRIEGMSKQDLGPRRERRPADSARNR